MRKALSAAAAALLLVFAACDTDPATDVTYDSATLHGQFQCSDGVYDASAQFELRKAGGTFAPAGPSYPFHCENQPGAELNIPDTVVGDLDHDSHYEYRLAANDGHTYDSNGTQDGTVYDSFDTATFPTVGVRTVHSFRDSLGVNVKTAYIDTAPYSDPADLKAALLDIGIYHVRDGLWFPQPGILNGGWDRQKTQWPDLAAAGIHALVGYGCATDDAVRANIPAALDAVQQYGFGSYIDGWENPNEVNYAHSGACDQTNWQTETRAYAQAWHDAIAAHGLDDRPIVGPSCGGWDCEDQLGDLSAWVDGGNVHPYRGTGIPETAAPDKCDEGTRYVPGGSCWITEEGWSVFDWSGGDERVQAAYTLRAYIANLQYGVPRTYMHQIVDLWLGQENTHEGSFGFYKADWSPRLVATAIKRMNAVLGDGSPALKPLAYRVDSGPSDLARSVMQKANGDYAVMLWRPVAAIPGTPRAGNALTTLTLPDAASVGLLRPLDSATVTNVPLDEHGSFSLGVSSEPEFLIVHPEP